MIIIVKYSDIHKAVVTKIKNKYPGIVFSTDVKEGLSKPSFFVSMGEIRAKDFNSEALDRNLTVRIYYFPEQNNARMELMDIIDGLNEIFIKDSILKIEEMNVELFEEIEIEILDNVLHYYIPIYISQNYERTDDKENMEELHVRSDE